VKNSPNEKRPVRAVPKPANRKNYQRVADCLRLAFVRASERNVEIIAKPRVERNMPTTPKFRDISRKIRERKIRRKTDSEKLCAANRHVGIARKIAVNLYRIKHGNDGERASVKRFKIAPNKVHRASAIVGDDHFFEKSPEHLTQAVRRKRSVKMPRFFVLRKQFRGVSNRSREELREKTQIRENAHGIAWRGDFSSKNIGGATERGKRVKRNSDGQNDF